MGNGKEATTRQQGKRKKEDAQATDKSSSNGSSFVKKSRTKSPIIRIIFVTGNAKKLEEVKSILFDHESTARVILSSRKLDLDEPQFKEAEEICEWKVLRAAETLRKDPNILKPTDEEIAQLNKMDTSMGTTKDNWSLDVMLTYVLTEDTCLCFDALNGYPGPYIKWFLEKLGLDGLNTLIDGFMYKSASTGQELTRSRHGNALCTFALASVSPTDEEKGERSVISTSEDGTMSTIKTASNVLMFAGKTYGTIVQPRGPNAFGWDPIFQPEGSNKTFAEMSKEEKNKISHRFRALEGLKKWLATGV